MISPTLALRTRLALRKWSGLCAGAFLLLATPQAASAQGRLDAQYEATLSGIPVGKGAWTIDISDDQYTAAASGGTAGLLKTRDPLGPHSLALAEAFLAPLQEGGLTGRQTALAFSLIYDYTLGFALSDRTTVNEQRVQDAATRHQLHAFFRALPADRFPVLAALGEHVWADNRDQRFTASLDIMLDGLQAAQRQGRHPRP